MADDLFLIIYRSKNVQLYQFFFFLSHFLSIFIYFFIFFIFLASALIDYNFLFFRIFTVYQKITHKVHNF